MTEAEAARRARLADRIAQIEADDRYPSALKAYLVEEETKIAERQIAEMTTESTNV
jgi:hypothetical protein